MGKGYCISKAFVIFCSSLPHILFIFLFSGILSGINRVSAQSWSTHPADNAYPRFEAPAVKMGNKLYTFMGVGNGFIFSNHIEVYDFTTNTWEDRGAMPNGFTHQGIAGVGTDIWMAGGRNAGLIDQASVHIYHTQSHTWSMGPTLPDVRAGGALVYLDGLLHFLGGFKVTHGDSYFDCPNEAQYKDHWVLDPLDPSQGWQVKSPMPKGLTHFAATVAHNHLFVFGGQNNHDCDGTDYAYVYAYDPLEDNWTQKKSLPSPRSHNESACVSYNGRIFLLGGQGSGSHFAIFDPLDNTWSSGPNLPIDLMGAIASVHENELFLMMGGSSAPAPAFISAKNKSYKLPLILPAYNDAPIVEAIPNQVISALDIVSLQVEAIDPEGAPLNFVATGLPQGLDISSSNGKITGTLRAEPGRYPVMVEVADPSGKISRQAFSFVVEEAVNLPVVLLSLTVQRKGTKALLNWITDSEENFSHFEIERRRQGIAGFNFRGSVQGGPGTYYFEEEVPAFEDVYYRIKAIDLDGSFMYSSVLQLGAETGNGLELFPNPGQLHVEGKFWGLGKPGSLSIYGALGQQVYHRAFNFRTGMNTFYIDISRWPRGMYIVKVHQGGMMYKKPLIKY